MSVYGLPYMGSKNKIAPEIADILPAADTFVDLFAGGCAMAHAALKTGKYQKMIINDIDGLPTQLFIDAIDGKYTNGVQWVSREDFRRLKNTDGFVKFCFSFGGNGVDYLYSKGREKYQRALYMAVVDDDYSGLRELGIDTILPDGDIEIKRAALKGCGIRGRVDVIERLNRINQLTELQPYRNNIIRFCADYSAVEIPTDSVVYCDIPYSNARGYNRQPFNREAFLNWAAGRENLYISEYNIDDERFECIWEKQRTSSYSATNNGLVVTEKLYKAKTE